MRWALHIFQCMENLESECGENKEGAHSLGKASWAYIMEKRGGGKRGSVKPSPGHTPRTVGPHLLH